MKELSIEQKAQRYDEAIEKLRDFYRDYDTVSRLIDVKEELANLIPELKESEDEKIKKDIISHFAKGIEGSSFDEVREKYKIWIAWLEKQGEQKPYGQREECKDCQFNYAGECKGSCAMKKGEKKPADRVEPKFEKGNIIKEKETGNLFYVNSIEDFGYTLHYKDCIAKGCTMSFKYEDNYELVEQKPAWSEEDEERINSILFGISYTYSNGHYPKDTYQKDINWLKSLRERYTWKPSEEQMKALSIAMCGVEDPLFSLYQDLKKLKE